MGDAANTTGRITTGRLLTTCTEFAKSRWSGFSVSEKLVVIFWLEDPKNVIVVHCNSGKGRTGTAICAILLYMGFCNTIEDCLRFYGHQRFTCGKGVSQPCQIRYLYYFEGFYKKQIKSPAVKRLTGIQFDKVPKIKGSTCTPGFIIYNCQGMEVTKIISFPATTKYT